MDVGPRAHGSPPGAGADRKSIAKILMRGTLGLLLAGSLIAQAHSAEPIISTVAGGADPIDMDGIGDGGPATQAYLSWPRGVATDGTGNLYIADSLNFRVRKVTSAGTITTIAGKYGSGNFNGDGMPANQAELSVWAVDVDGIGNIYVADKQNARIRRIAPSGIISTIAGSGVQGFAGDGGLATSARLNQPDDVAVDAAGNLYLLDQGNQRVRKVSAGIITTVAGNGQAGFGGDGGPAKLATLNNPQAIAVDVSGNLYIADTGNDRVRRVTPDGKIGTIAGGGPFRADPLAANVTLEDPLGVAVDGGGNVYITEARNTVRMIGADGVIRTVAGVFDDISGLPAAQGSSGLGDGGPARAAGFESPEDLTVDQRGNILIADRGNGRIRKVTPIPNQPTPLGLRGFRPYTLIPVNGPLGDVVSGDITGDGRDDVIMTTRLGRFIYDPAVDLDLIIMVQRQDGTLGAPIRLNYPSVGYRELSSMGAKLALADFNRDGIKDVAVSHEAGIDLVLGRRSGTFVVSPFNGQIKPEPVTDIAAMDVDRDGNQDVVAEALDGTWISNYGIRTFYGNGMGSVRSFADLDRHEILYNLVTSDLTGDGLVDLAYIYQSLADNQDHGIEIRPQGPTGGFRPVTIYPMGAGYVSTLSTADFNGDDRADLAFAQTMTEEGMARPGLALVAQGAGGQLQAPAYRQVYSYASDSAVRPVGGNAASELVLLYPGDNAVGYFPRQGNGWGMESKYFVPGLIVEERPSIATGDVDHDGLADVLVAVPGQGLAILYAEARAPQRSWGDQPRVPGRGAQSPSSTGDVIASHVQAPIRGATPRLPLRGNEAVQGSGRYLDGAMRTIGLAARQLGPVGVLRSIMRWASRRGLPVTGIAADLNDVPPQSQMAPASRSSGNPVKAKAKAGLLPDRDTPVGGDTKQSTSKRPGQR